MAPVKPTFSAGRLTARWTGVVADVGTAEISSSGRAGIQCVEVGQALVPPAGRTNLPRCVGNHDEVMATKWSIGESVDPLRPRIAVTEGNGEVREFTPIQSADSPGESVQVVSNSWGAPVSPRCVEGVPVRPCIPVMRPACGPISCTNGIASPTMKRRSRRHLRAQKFGAQRFVNVGRAQQYDVEAGFFLSREFRFSRPERHGVIQCTP